MSSTESTPATIDGHTSMAPLPEDWADFTRRAMSWPSLAEIRSRYGVTEDFLRGTIAAGLVECIRLDRMRINPESWEDFLASRYSPRTR